MPTPFSLLADPAGYVPCSTENMHTDVEFREHWGRHFMRHFTMVMQLAVDVYGPETKPRADACYADLIAKMQHVLDHPEAFARLDLLFIDSMRQDVLVAHGFPDPFEKAKARENDACLPIYPSVVAELDSHTDPREALLLAVEGIFAGNLFDQGVSSTLKLFGQERPDFLAIRDSLDGKRPWLIDSFDAWERSWHRPPVTRASSPASAHGPFEPHPAFPAQQPVTTHPCPATPPLPPLPSGHVLLRQRRRRSDPGRAALLPPAGQARHARADRRQPPAGA